MGKERLGELRSLPWRRSSYHVPGYVPAVGPSGRSMPFLLVLAAVSLYTGVFFVLRLRLYDSLLIGIRDQGLFQQALYNTLHGRFLETSVGDEGYRHLWAEHAYLFIVAVLPFYALAPYAATLFLLEAGAAGAGGLALYLVARRRLGYPWLAVVVSVAYLLYPAVQWANLGLVWYGFHLENFFPPLFLLAVAAADAGRPRSAAVLFFSCLTVSEVFAVPVMAYGLVRAAGAPRDRKLALTVVLVALIWFWVASALLIPSFRDGHAPRQVNAGAQLLTLLQHREALADYVQHWAPAALAYLAFFLKPLGWLPLAGPTALLTALPALLLNFLAPLTLYDIPVRPQSWHGVALLPLVTLAAVDGLGNLLGVAKRAGWERSAVMVLPLALLAHALVATVMESPLPFSRSTYLDLPALYQVEDRSRDTADLTTLIPEDASVSAGFFLGSHLLNRQHLYVFPRKWQETDYVALDLRPQLALAEQDLAVVEQLRESRDYEAMYEQGTIVVFRRRR